MRRAEQNQTMKPQPKMPRLSLLAAACLLAGPAWADSTPPRGSPRDVAYTALDVVGGQPLYPQVAGEAAPPQVLRAGGVVAAANTSYGANAAVARLVVEVARNGVPADGQSEVPITLRLFGTDGQPLAGEAFVTVEHSGGRIRLPGARTDELGPMARDADRATPGIQLPVRGGVAQLLLLAPAEAQDVRLRVTAGSQEAAGSIRFVPEMRDMIAAGLVEGIVGLNRRVSISPARQGDGFEQEITAWSREFNQGKANVAARAAFYLKGTVRGDVLLTAAYDSDKDTRARLLRDIRPDEQYPVYGDASLRSFDARSAQRLYLRLDKGRSYVLYGDFATGDGFSQPLGQGAVASLKQRSLGQYNRTATGARVHHETERLAANLFVINDSLRQVVQEFASQGSGPYGLRHNAVLEGSEKVEVLVRDRAQPSRILAVRPLVRLVDYSFEPFSGRIVLATFLPAVDDSLNPMSLRVSYEVGQGGDAFWLAGGDAQYRLTDRLEIGGSAVHDRNGLSPYDLASANLTWKPGERTAVVAEVARSKSTVNTNAANQNVSPGLAGKSGELSGQAWRVEAVHEGERLEARAFVGRSAPEFNNPAAPLAGGRQEAHAKAGFKLTQSLKLVGDYLASDDLTPGGGERQAAALGVQWAATRSLTLELGVRQQRETVGTQGNGVVFSPFGMTDGLTGSLATGSGGGALGFGSAQLDPATGLPLITQGGLPQAASSLPAGTQLEATTVRLGAGWRASERVRLGAEVEHELDGDVRRRAAAGLDYQLAERTRLYGRFERQSGWVQAAGLTDAGTRAEHLAFGIDTSYLRDTQVFSEYRLRDAMSARDAVLASGARQVWDWAPGVRVNLGLERHVVLHGSTAPVQAVHGGLDYTAHPLWRAGTKLEWRRSGDQPGTAENEQFDTVLWQGMAARKLSRDWTALARNYLLVTRYAARGDVAQNRAQLGLAWRPVDDNRLNALAKLEHKLERDASNAAVGELSTRAWIGSAHADFHPSRPWWFTGRVAAKWQADQFEGGVPSRFRAGLVAGRMVYDITENWDLGLLAAVQLGQGGARQHAFGLEAGYLLAQNLWLSAGFNAAGFHGDRDLTGYEYTRSGVYVRLRFKFDETLLSGKDREVNRALPR
ncbi:MAG: hypothetical protein U1E71_15145 [Ramlibacter sp.]|jgi:hypothetical protein